MLSLLTRRSHPNNGCHLLQGTELIDREAVFAPRFVTIDALNLNMQVIDAGGH